MTDFADARLGTLAALFMEYHRDAAELFGFDELAGKYHFKYDRNWFAPIIADLRQLLIVADTKDGVSAALRPDGYGEALEKLLARARGTQIQIDWRKEEILTDASDIDWFPSPNGWKYFQLEKDPPDQSQAASAPISQPKIDLAVLYRLHQHAEAGGGAIPPVEVQHLFKINISMRRIELALNELLARQDVEREYHPHYFEEGLWQVSREGMARVDRALRVPTSFIARLHASGDGWLESDEAKQAVLKRLSSQQDETKAEGTEVPAAAKAPTRSMSTQVDWTKWGTVFAGVGIVVSVLLWYFS